MEFLTATVLSGIVWDGMKKIGEITGDYIKNQLRGWLINDEIANEIAKNINQIPQPFKENSKYIEVYIDQNKELLDLMKKIEKDDNDEQSKYKQDNSNSEINNSNVINGNNNNIYYIDPKQLKENEEGKLQYNNRGDLKREIKKILAENRAIYKLYGPTNQNKLDLFSEKSNIWNEKALDSIIPNNKKIVQLLELNSSMLSEEEYEIFIEFKLHADGFESNHKSKEKRSDYPVFPEGINNILN